PRPFVLHVFPTRRYSHLFIAEGEIRTHGGNKDSILADTFEALIGATYLHAGFPAAWTIVQRHVIPLLDDEHIMGAGKDWKTLVQMAVDQRGLGPIEYQVEGTGPDHDRTFKIGRASGRERREDL